MAELRVEIGRALQAHLTPKQISKLIDEVLAIEKRTNGEFVCKNCGQRQRQWVQIHDARAVTTALADLMAQAYGRPQEASENTDPIQFYRLTNMEEVDALRLVQEEWRGQSGERGENGTLRAEPDANEGVPEAQGSDDLQGVDSGDTQAELRRCVRCSKYKLVTAFIPFRQGAQVCSDCRAA